MHCELEHVDLLCINDPTAILSPLTLKGLVPGGAIFMQSPYADPAEVWKRIPAQNQQDDPREEGPRLLLRHGQDRPRGRVASRPADAHAGHRAARGVPAS